MNDTRASLPRRHFFGRAIAAGAGVLGLGGWSRRAEAAPQLDDTPFIGEIRLFAGATPPTDWVFCQGQILPISGNDALFNLIGSTYGGDGINNFALPDLRGRIPVHVGSGFALGQSAGQEQVTLILNQIPSHTHAAGAVSANGSSDDPTGRAPARNAAGVPEYATTADTDLSSSALLASGGGSAHTNLQPYLGIQFMISLTGVFPSQT